MRIRILILAVLLLVFSTTAFAQGNLLNYGDSVLGEISATSPLAFHTFSGTQGDQVSIQVIGVGIDPAVSLNAPTQQQLANNDNDPANPGSTDARISVSLPQSGVYTILVSSVTGTPGQFLIRLSGHAPPVGQALSNTPALVDVAAGPQAQVFTLSADPTAPITLNISTSTPDFTFGAVIRDANGSIVALVTASTAFTFTLPPGEGTYTVEVTPSDPASSGQISIGLGAATVPAPAVTEEASAPPVPVDESGICMVAAQGTAVNVRSGPSTDFTAIAQLEPGVRVPVTGVSGTWYQINIPNVGAGWVRRDVVTSFGPCDAVPVIDENQQVAPPVATEEAAPPAQITATFTPTSTPTLAQNGVAPVEVTPTYTATTAQEQQVIEATPSYTPTTAQQPTATYTPSYTPTTPLPPPTAPPDSNYALVIPLDSTASVTDFVSYPGGDREDRVSWRVTGMNSSVALPGGRARLILSVSCFGTGTQNVTFFTGGQTYSCGQTIRDEEVTFDSNTSSVLITAVAGENTYVQWVLTGTATRIN